MEKKPLLMFTDYTSGSSDTLSVTRHILLVEEQESVV